MVLATPGNVKPVRIEEEMRGAYLDYAMSVIVSRALPDVRDGLKPVHRRILFAMHGMGLRPNSSYKKSAGVVGEVLGKYHPHGDSPVYDSLVRMAQAFSLRNPLIDGQGNFGSVDDDPPAAMRYTEVRLASIAEEMLVDIDRNTVDFADNYDGSHQEPRVLPARLPNLLVNGASGIAVGMTTNVPPHNLNEICAAMVHLIDHPDAPIEELLAHVQGPDFPTAGIIMGREGMEAAYETGRGRFIVRARATIEEASHGNQRDRIIVSELPYQVNKAALVQKIAALAKEKRMDGIAEVRDESDRKGMRMIVELHRGAPPAQVLNNLYKHTSMQSAFHMNMLALVDGQPRVLGLKAALSHYIDFRRNVVRRRAEFDLGKARERAHILAGLRTALLNLDAVIALIRGSEDVESARQGLIAQFDLDEIQAQAILDMQLRRLAALEREKIESEYQELQKWIGELEGLLADPSKVLKVVKEETLKHQKKYGDPRRTEIRDEEAMDFTKEQLTPHQDVVITLSDRGYIKRIPKETYRLQHRAGKGSRGQQTREGDAIRQIIIGDTHDWLLFFTDLGRVYRHRCFEVPPDTSKQTRGTTLQNLINIPHQTERVTAVLAVQNLYEDQYILLGTRRGEVKRMHLSQLSNIRSNGLNAMDLEKNDTIIAARLAEPETRIIIVSRLGQGIQFTLDQVRVRQTRGAGGVRGIRLDKDDEVIAMEVVTPNAYLLTLSDRGYGKRTRVDRFPLQGRLGHGVIATRITDKSGPVAAAVVVTEEIEEVIVGTRKAMVFRTPLSEIPRLGRATQGVMVMDPKKLASDDRIISVSTLIEREEEKEPPAKGQRKGGLRSRNGHKNGKETSQLALDVPLVPLTGDEPQPTDELDEPDELIESEDEGEE